MSEEKLTVAELLARAAKDKPAEETPRRRRRRSLEDGGISVAELTGSIPRVKAEGPRRGAHALKSDAEEFDQELEAEKIAQAEAASAAEDAEAPVAEESALVDEVSAVDEPVAEDEQADEQTAEDAEPIAEDGAGVAEAVEKPLGKALPVVVPRSPRPVLYNEERSEITYTFTDLRDVENSELSVGEPGPVAREVLEGSLSYDDRPTASIPVVTEVVDEPVMETRPVEVTASELTENSESAELSDDTATLTAVTDEAEALMAAEAAEVAEETTDVEVAPEAELDESPDEYDSEEADDEFDGKAVAGVGVGAGAATAAAAAVAVGSKDEAEEESKEGYSEDNSLSITLLIIQVFVGLLVGSLVFLGFTLAWERLPKIVAGLLAVVVTGLFVLGANFLRRERDIVTPILAGIVGIALTFGPWVLFNL